MIFSKNYKIVNIAIELASHSLEGKKLSKLSYTDEEMQAVYEYVKVSGIGGITYIAIEDLISEEKSNDENSFYFEWKKLRLNALRRSLIFSQEREQILDFFEKNGIWYMPLKGIVIKDFYPEPDAREMNDNDILIDPSKREDAGEFMYSIGYEKFEHDNIDDEGHNADEYIKKPFLYFELHKVLVEDNFGQEMSEYYRNVKDILIKDENNDFGYHFSDEDFYIYLIVHAYKHFIRNGIGIRFLADVYVYLTTHQNLDSSYIDKTCETFGIDYFEKEVREVALKAFDLNVSINENELSSKQKTIFGSVVGAGTFGNLETRWKNEAFEMEAKSNGSLTKKDYIKKRMFPDDRWYRIYHPFIAKHKILKVPFTVYRLVVLAFRGRNRIKREMDYFGKD